MTIERFASHYGFLSNFYRCPFTFEDHRCDTAEHAYQAAKAIDVLDAINIRATTSPGKAKRAGRRIPCRSDWEVVKLYVMTDVVWTKFSQIENVRDLLLQTGDQELIEGNTWGDRYWGQVKGEGENHLGKILMEVRDKLRRSSS